MTSVYTCRVEACAALTQLLAANTDLAGVAVLDGWQPRDVGYETIVVGMRLVGTDGGVRDMRRGRKARKDQFEIVVWMQAGVKGQTIEEARARALVMLHALEDTIANDVTLDGVPGLMWAQLKSFDGPDTDATQEGFAAFVTAKVECYSEQN